MRVSKKVPGCLPGARLKSLNAVDDEPEEESGLIFSAADDEWRMSQLGVGLGIMFDDIYAQMEIVVNSLFVLDNFGAKKLVSIASITGPNRYRKVEDT